MPLSHPPFIYPTIIRLSSVKARTGLSRSGIYLMISQKTFPSPIKLGARSVGWLDSEITEWINNRVAGTRCQKQI